ncbi:MAG: hypothetical protein COC06_04560 [Bacteroidales bacterium]|nr:MAG: hypothetical protein COC06_04560 [Bacteroidales bacterium]
MNEIDNIKRLLIPAVKGIPIILGITLIAILLAMKVIIYKVPMYQSFSLLRLDDKSTGLSETNLYKDFDVFFTPQKIAAEVEVLKSGELISRVAGILKYDISYYREGRIRRHELYKSAPFEVEFKHLSLQYYDKEFLLDVRSSNEFRLGYYVQDNLVWLDGRFSEAIDEGVFVLQINKTSMYKQSLEKKVLYVFVRNSRRKQMENIKSNLFVKEVDKDVAVIRIGFKAEVPEKAAEVVNALANGYIENYIALRTNAADKTGYFISDRLIIVSEQLAKSEHNLEKFRSENKIVNFRQQTETGLREASQIRIQYNNILMQEAALDSLNIYINSNSSGFMELAPQVTFGDLLFTELIKKMKTFEGERRELLLKYTLANEKVKVMDSKIADLTIYIKESIRKTKEDISIRRKELQIYLAKVEQQFDKLPSNEKQMVILEREFRLNQEMYNFLTQKKLEASIVKAATISFHQILEFGVPGSEPVSPNKKLILFVSGLLGILLSISFIYLKEFLSGKILSRSQLEKLTSLPIIGVLPKAGSKHGKHFDTQKFSTLASEFEVRKWLNKGSTFLLSSSLPGEGKSYVSLNLAKAFQKKGKTVCVVDLNLFNPGFRGSEVDKSWVKALQDGEKIDYSFIAKNNDGVDVLPCKLNSESKDLNEYILNLLISNLKEMYDIVIFDSSATVIVNDSLLLFSLVDQVIYLYRSKFTGIKYAQQAELLANEYGWKNIYLVLNCVHPATNFSGHYTGSRYSYEYQNGNMIDKLKHYLNIYLR